MKKRSFRKTKNLVSGTELASIMASLPDKYRPLFLSPTALKSLRKSARAAPGNGMHFNSPIRFLSRLSKKSIGREITPNGLFHSRILHEISSGLSWAEAEKKHGEQKVKTACSDFVRQFPSAVARFLG